MGHEFQNETTGSKHGLGQDSPEAVESSMSSMASLTNAICHGEGAKVIMLHGLASSLHDWDFIVPELVSSGYQACTLDLLGHGDSLKPPRIADYSIDNVYKNFTAWLDSLALHKPVVLVGHSLGGYLALLYALQFPSMIRGLVLANPFYSLQQLPRMLQVFFRYQLLNTSLIERTPYWLFRILIDLTSLSFGGSDGDPHNLPEQVRIQTALDYKRASPAVFNIPRTLRDLLPEVSQITAPTFIIWGARDQTLAPSSFPKLVRLISHAQGDAISNCGHVPHQCHPKNFNQKVLHFLSSL